MLPFGLQGHKCSDHWECFALDKAGCTLCGNLHICSAACDNLMQESDSTVCVITGLCVHTVQFQDERVFLGNAHSTSRALVCNKRRYTGYKPYCLEQIQSVVRHILNSKHSIRSFTMEKLKLRKRITGCCQRVMRVQRSDPTTRMNMLTVTQEIAAELENTRIISSHIDTRVVENMVVQCSACIFAFMHTCQRVIPHVLHATNIDNFIIGALYIMRTGITIKNFEVLKCVVQLRCLLPLESLLQQCFNIKPKIITEVENIIKSNMRKVSKVDLHRM
jgi:hypothetical protein